jgi:hypothetical protein
VSLTRESLTRKSLIRERLTRVTVPGAAVARAYSC